ncbi:MAG: hypothetical protein IPL61_39855 [Myxococcales bacterium]|nr:hypothetical protein [Myxococcales bacterium]
MRYLVMFAFLTGAAACGEVSSNIPDAQTTCVPACGANATCQGTACACDSGYEMVAGACTDIDECAVGNGGCAADAMCTNTAGARTCACDAGFLGDGLACRPVWTLEATVAFDINPSNFGAAFVAHNNFVFIGVETNTPTAKAFRSFNTSNMMLSGPLALPPTSSDDFCACGATQTMVSNGTTIYMFGNYAMSYDPATNRWLAINGYTTGADYRRAEAASVYNPMSGLVEIFGGRGPVADTVTYQAPATFAFGSNLPIAITDAVAYLPANGATIYMAGGQQQGGADRILTRPTSLNSWTILGAAPGSLSSPIGMGDFGSRIWVATRERKIYFFDPTAMAWDHTLDLPGDTLGVVTTNAGTFAFVHTATAMLEVYKLANID